MSTTTTDEFLYSKTRQQPDMRSHQKSFSCPETLRSDNMFEWGFDAVTGKCQPQGSCMTGKIETFGSAHACKLGGGVFTPLVNRASSNPNPPNPIN